MASVVDPSPPSLPEPLRPRGRTFWVEAAALALSPALLGAFVLHGLFPSVEANPGNAPSPAVFVVVMGALLLAANLRRVALQSVVRVGIPVIAAAAAMAPSMLLRGGLDLGLLAAWLIFAVVIAAPMAVLQLVVDGLNSKLIVWARKRLQEPAALAVQLAGTAALWWAGTGGRPFDRALVVPSLLAWTLLGLWTWCAVDAIADRRRRRIFLEEVEAGKVRGLRVEARPEGAVLVRVAREVGYREAAADEVIGSVAAAIRGLNSDNR